MPDSNTSMPAGSALPAADAFDTLVVPAVFASLAPYLSASRKQAATCIETVKGDNGLPNYDVGLAFHFVKFDSDHEPHFPRLAKVLARHLVRYCFSVRSRSEHEKNVEDIGEGQLFMLARDMFRKVDTSGEVGELLLFFILEAIVGAPQVIAKMELKTNPGDEVKGCDGIHLGWDGTTNQVLFYLGESKLYGRFSDALKGALESVASLNEDGRRESELNLMTSHFKHVDPSLKDEVLKVAGGTSAVGSRFVHACLLGYDWAAYAEMVKDKKGFAEGFVGRYKSEIERLTVALAEKLKDYKYSNLRFDFIFLPFVSVQGFRDAFYREILGGK